MKITTKSTKGGAKWPTSLQKNGLILPGFGDHNSLATPALLNPKTPMTKRKGGQQRAHSQVITETPTEPESLPPKANPCSLQ